MFTAYVDDCQDFVDFFNTRKRTDIYKNISAIDLFVQNFRTSLMQKNT